VWWPITFTGYKVISVKVKWSPVNAIENLYNFNISYKGRIKNEQVQNKIRQAIPIGPYEDLLI